MRHDAPPPNDSVEECRRIVRSLPPDERAAALALGAAFEAICREWNTYLDALSVIHRANRYALASAIVVEAAVARRLAAGDGPATPQDALGQHDGLTEVVRATEGREAVLGRPGASSEGEANSARPCPDCGRADDLTVAFVDAPASTACIHCLLCGVSGPEASIDQDAERGAAEELDALCKVAWAAWEAES